MTGSRDPFERLKDADPAKSREAAQSSRAKVRAMYSSIVTSDPLIPPPPWRRRRRVSLLVGAALLLVAAGYLLFRPVTEPLTVGCYRTAALDADRIVLPASPDIPATDLCVTVWQPDGEYSVDTGGQPPPLTACVLDSGTIAVFPSTDSDDVCERLGLAHPEQTSTDENHQIIDLQDALVSRFLDECLDLPRATAIVEEELNRRALNEWQVVSRQPFTPSRSCASLAIDPTVKTIELIPVSP